MFFISCDDPVPGGWGSAAMDGPPPSNMDHAGIGGPGPSDFGQLGLGGPPSGYVPPGGFHIPPGAVDVLGPARGTLDFPSPNNQYPTVPPSGAHAPPSTPQDPASVIPATQPQHSTSYEQMAYNQPAPSCKSMA